ncbi:hypothetical protein BdWA1_003021 [Babesia duncani]|uniref:Uncharacterized protein n=1 Tax=Babesia duncani TaxID=323732 RepID=A0AAD9PIK3_9APIC|nr:hypothetical protein BdWA1_003021 [Babesia duncani]
MGFPDVAKIEQRGGSLYTHLMDAPTLVMALKLAMSLNSLMVSLLYLYFSECPHFDYKFVATFVGRILATLNKFTLDECANVLMAMKNPQYYHEKTQLLILAHAESVCLTCKMNLEQSLHFLVACRYLEKVPENILIAIGELVQVEPFNEDLDKDLIHEALDSCCCIHSNINVLAVARIYRECCKALESDTTIHHERNLAILNAIATYPHLEPNYTDLAVASMHKGIADATLEQQCRYLYFSSILEFNARILVQGKCNLYTTQTSPEVMKHHKTLQEEPKLAVAALAGIFSKHSIQSNIPRPLHVQMLNSTSQKMDTLDPNDVAILRNVTSELESVNFNKSIYATEPGT